MDAFLGMLNNPFVLTGLQLGFGLVVKRVPAFAAWPNKLIPVFNAVLAVLVKLGAPATAHAGGLDSLIGHPVGSLIIESVTQTLFTTGLHSSFKNFWQNFAKAALSRG